MATLYNIEQSLMDCINPETGEVVNTEMWEQLLQDRRKKLEGIALWIKNLEADAAAYGNEKKAFEEREKQALNKIKGLKMLLTNALSGEKFSTEKCAVSFRKSRSVKVDESAISRDWCSQKITYIPDKSRIKTAIEAGNVIPGAYIEEKLNIQIK